MTTVRQHFTRRFALALIPCFCMLITSCSLGASNPAPTPTPTIPQPTATPNIALSAPHVVAAWLSPFQSGPCEGVCSTVNFTTTGPFVMLVSCDGYQQFSGSLPTVDFQLFDANGHQVDAFHRTCGDPNKDVVTNFVVPESLPAGTYQLVINIFPWQCSVTVIEASH